MSVQYACVSFVLSLNGSLADNLSLLNRRVDGSRKSA